MNKKEIKKKKKRTDCWLMRMWLMVWEISVRLKNYVSELKLGEEVWVSETDLEVMLIVIIPR